MQSSRKFNLNQHVERVHKGQQQQALNPQLQQIKIQTQLHHDQQQLAAHHQLPQSQDHHHQQSLQIVPQPQQQPQPLQIQLQAQQQTSSQIQTISLNPPTMVGGLHGLKIEPVAVPVTSVAASTPAPQQQTVTASLVMQPPKPGQTGPPVFTLNFPSQPAPVQQQQVHVQQVHVQQVQPLTVTVKRKTAKTHDCK